MPEDSNHGGSAYPTVWTQDTAPGMTLRDWFAGQALAGLMSQSDYCIGGVYDAAEVAYDQADLILEERAKGDPG